MAKLSRGITFAANDYITAAKLHALIDTAIAQADAFPGVPTIYDVVMGDFASGVRAFHTAASPASPASNDLAVGSDGLLDRYTGSTWVDLASDFITLVNNSSFTLVTGTPVVADATSGSNCNLWAGSGVCPEPLGISTGVAAPSANATLQIRGLARCRVNSPLTVAVGDHLRIGAAGATALSSTNSVLTDVLAMVVQADVDSPLSGNVLAVLVH